MPKDLVLLAAIRTPPMGTAARREAGFLLRQIQEGEKLSLPLSRPMPSVGKGCHELRVTEKDQIWRIVLHITGEEIVVLDVFKKKTNKTPRSVIERCKKRLRAYQE